MSDQGHTTSHTAAPADAHTIGHEHHGPGLGQYLAVFAALCILTGASFFTYSSMWPFHNEPKITWTFMMAVSCTKAMLVILFFMHVKYEAGWKYVLTVPAAFMSVFLILALVPDVGLRSHWFSEERILNMAEPRKAPKPGLSSHEDSHESGDSKKGGPEHGGH
jgi:cytochrome c oxidase subunit IV